MMNEPTFCPGCGGLLADTGIDEIVDPEDGLIGFQVDCECGWGGSILPDFVDLGDEDEAEDEDEDEDEAEGKGEKDSNPDAN